MTFFERLTVFALVATGIQYGLGAARLTRAPREWLAALLARATLPDDVDTGLARAAAVLRFLACTKCCSFWIGVGLHAAGASPFTGRAAPLVAGLSAAVLVSILRSHMDLTAT